MRIAHLALSHWLRNFNHLHISYQTTFLPSFVIVAWFLLGAYIFLRQSVYAQTNYSKSQKFKEPPKETCTLVVKEGLRTEEIFFGKVKIPVLIDSGSTISLLRENTSRRIMDPTKLSKNKMLLTGIGEANVTTIGSFEHEFKIDDENYSLTWHVVPADKLKFEAVIG
ncbi:uncharacterized protein TNCV_442771 [Trichonephila clavipes]|nr:uncharacterized protein TNCV_442771 [Trichonephila clavipes]